MKLVLVVSLVIFTFSCTQKGFSVISKNIERKCTDGNWKGISFHELRTKLYNKGRLNFVSSDNDTLFVLESYEIESGTYFSRIWNAKADLNYSYNNNSFSFDQPKLFTDYTLQLVQNWDTATIRNEESLNARSIPVKYINATRISIVNKEVFIECIKFKEFFKLERDR